MVRATNRTGKLLIGTLALAIGWGTAASYASAADSGFIGRMTKQYAEFEAKHQQAYNRYYRTEKGLYDTYHRQMTAVYDKMLKQARDDLNAMTATFQSDIASLKRSYDVNSDAFREYERATDKDRAGDPMDLYEDAMDPDKAGGPMDRFEDSLDPDSAGDATDEYADELDPDSAGSAMDEYADEVDPDSAGSVMDEFADESSVNSSGSVMDRYEDGELTLKEAEKLMAQALAKAEAGMDKRIEETKRAVQIRKNQSLKDIRDAWLNARNSILSQREAAIAAASSAREKLTSTGISFPLLVLDDWMTVVVNGDYMIFEQPPTVVDGTTLVPMRAIFEKLGASVVWRASDRTITAKKGKTTIWLQLGNANAKVGAVARKLEAAPRTVNGSTMVPLRFVSEALGAGVKWDDRLMTITITSSASAS